MPSKSKSKKLKKSEKPAKSLDDFLHDLQNSEDDEVEQNGNNVNGAEEVDSDDGLEVEMEEEDEESGTDEEMEEGGDTSDIEIENEDDDDEASDDGDGTEEVNQKYLLSLKDKDPEFHKFLLENDKNLLQMSDDDNELAEEDQVHRPPDQLEVASDESDFEDEVEEKGRSGVARSSKFLKKHLDELETQLESKNVGVKLLNELAQVLKSAIYSVAQNKSLKNEDGFVKGKFFIEGSTLFNSVIRLCVTKFEPALRKVLRLEGDLNVKKIMNSKKWKPMNSCLKSYTMDLTKLVTVVTEETALCAILKHVHQLLPYYACLPKSTKHLLQKLVLHWSQESEAVRMTSFLCIMRLARILQKDNAVYESMIKQMYLAYVKNSKFTSPSTYPVINFMRRSLAEIFVLSPKLAYNHAFIYIRQLGISLRNAITLQKKDSIQSVYNWQFVHSIHLWVQILCSNLDSLTSLIYPLVQVMDGTIKLIYTSKYYPLRFHLCQMLTQLSAATGQFIPILPYYLDILNNYNFNKKSTKVSMKPVDFDCILRISKSQIAENGTKDTTMDKIYYGIFQYLHTQSHKVSFPDMVIPCLMQLKQFMKVSKVSNYGKKIKQLVDKIEENRKFLIKERKLVDFGVGDHEKITMWEEALQNRSTPLSKFFLNLKNVKNDKKKQIQASEMDDYKFIPKIDRTKAAKKAINPEKFEGIFGNDDDSDDSIDDETRFESREERGKKKEILKRKKMEPKSNSDDDSEKDDVVKKAKKDETPEETSGSEEEEEDKIEALTLDDLDSDDDNDDDDIPDDEVSDLEESLDQDSEESD